MAATRLPGKPLIDICGKPMIQRVYERAMSAGRVGEVLVATPDEEIADAVSAFGGKSVVTSPDHRSGTDRLAEAASKLLDDDDIVVNVQGDEPLIPGDAIDNLVVPLLKKNPPEIASLMRRIKPEEAANPNLVKVVVDSSGSALYFSRSPIPYVRYELPHLAMYGHVGLYGYSVATLKAFTFLEPSPLELTESLEQLRALENGWRIQMVETDFNPIGVDTEEDLDKVRTLLSNLEQPA
ncbi:MAG: 3-deoxy-manno-octulosonate cytidylyltransferase [Armatimonadetes bacterium]|nr:3-deoxy-manno-octulosonate cytidylyltransferase [Armatimonadota bacterium]